MRLCNSLSIIYNKVNNRDTFISLFFLKFKNLLDDYIVNYKIKYLFYFLFIYFFIFEFICFSFNFNLNLFFSYINDLGISISNNILIHVIYNFIYNANYKFLHVCDVLFLLDMSSDSLFGIINGVFFYTYLSCALVAYLDRNFRRVGGVSFNQQLDWLSTKQLLGIRTSRKSKIAQISYLLLCFFFPMFAFFPFYLWARKVEKKMERKMPASYIPEEEVYRRVFLDVHTVETAVIYLIFVVTLTGVFAFCKYLIFALPMCFFFTVFLKESFVAIVNFFRQFDSF